MKLYSHSMVRALLLVASLLIWLNVYAIGHIQRVIAVPLITSALDSGLAIATPLTTLDLTLSGSRMAMSKSAVPNIHVTIDLTSVLGTGKYTLPLSLSELPAGIRALELPHTMEIVVENSSSKTVPVLPQTTGSLPDNHSLKSITAEPSTVTLLGAPTLLAGISEAKVYVNLNNHNQSFKAPGEAVVQSSEGKKLTNITVDPGTVISTVDIGEGAYLRNLGVSAKLGGELAAGFWIKEVRFDPPIVLVKGNQQILDKLDSLVTTEINLTGKSASFTDQVAVELPRGVELVGSNLLTAHITIALTQGNRQFDISPNYVGLGEGLAVNSISSDLITVVVSAEPGQLAKLNRSDIKLNLDLQGLVSGSSTVTVTSGMFGLPEGVQVVSFTPSQLDLVLTRQ